MPEFAIIRLGKDSVPDIEKLDTLHSAQADPIRLTVTCTQVPLGVGPGYYAFIYLGSDNSKGLQTKWKQGVRALGKIVNKAGGIKYADKCSIEIEAKVIFPESISKEDFLQRASNVYYWFSGMPIIGISSYSNQTVQQIRMADDPTQNISALFHAIQVADKSIRTLIGTMYPELIELFNFVPLSELETDEEDTTDMKRLQVMEEIEKSDDVDEGVIEKSGWGEYPLDSVFVRREQRTVNEVVKRITSNRFILNPDFQRDFVWPPKKQSKLIESCLMRIPLPVFYVAEAKDGRIIVVDGLQRLFTFTRFLKNEFALTDLGTGNSDPQDDNSLLGKYFKSLPISLQERIEDTQLTLYILDSKAPERAKLDIFDRVNSGEPLSRQQMRNCLFNGQATRWLGIAAKTTAFLNVTGGTLGKKTMRDREAINRFCAFKLLGVERYRGDMDEFLANTLEGMNKMNKIDLENLTTEFERSMKINFILFGKHAFRKSLAEQSKIASRTVINIALFDVCSVLFTNFEDDFIKKYADQIRNSIRALIKDESFSHAITYATNGVPQVSTRFRMMNKALEEVK